VQLGQHAPRHAPDAGAQYEAAAELLELLELLDEDRRAVLRLPVQVRWVLSRAVSGPPARASPGYLLGNCLAVAVVAPRPWSVADLSGSRSRARLDPFLPSV
jgi:hypothetical protein